MSAEILKYQKELIQGVIEVLKDELIGTCNPGDISNCIDAIARLEEARDMELATDEDEKVKIMNRWF